MGPFWTTRNQELGFWGFVRGLLRKGKMPRIVWGKRGVPKGFGAAIDGLWEEF